MRIDLSMSYELDGAGRVAVVEMMNGRGDKCSALLDYGGDNDQYNYYSKLGNDGHEVHTPKLMSLADCILASHVHLGLIPSQNFDPIACANNHGLKADTQVN